MADALELLFSGIILGLVQGISPGPLVTLVISETLKSGKKEGLKVAVSPLITDSTIILLTSLALSTVAEYSRILGVVALFGACYLIYLGVGNLRARTIKFEGKPTGRGAFKKGIITNFLNPHTYLFWLTVGGPIILESLRTNVFAAVPFLLGFYSFLIGSKASIALVVDRSKAFINNKHYSYVVRVLGLVLIFFALALLIEGASLMALL